MDIKPGSCCSHHAAAAGEGEDIVRLDRFFAIMATIVLASYGASYIFEVVAIPYVGDFLHHVKMFLYELAWGVVLGIFFVILLSYVPKALIHRILGKKPGLDGVARAAFAGVVFDTCSHGILLIAMKLYRQGVHISQVMAFLIASPWNSISLTVILITLIGWQWTLLFILSSTVLAITTGYIFLILEKRGLVPSNPHLNQGGSDLASSKPPTLLKGIILGLSESQMILKWLLLGVVIAALAKTIIPLSVFKVIFGPDLLGVFSTLVFSTVLEVCSEGLTPIASDILNVALAPGNAFLFLMAGVATDYTEILSLRETTKSWKIPLYLPLILVPQVIILAVIFNGLS